MATNEERITINPDRENVRLSGPVRITMPASVAYDLKAFQKSVADLAARLGCGTCFSGADCLFRQERDFVINEKRQIEGAPMEPGEPVPWVTGPELSSARMVTAILPKDVSHDIDKLRVSINNIVDKLGSCPCTSGFDLLLRQELGHVFVDRKGDARLLG